MRKTIINIQELVTLAPLAEFGRLTKLTAEDLGCKRNAWLMIEEGKVLGHGPMHQLPEYPGEQIDAGNGLVMPGLVDSHTHPLYAGNRSGEFWQRTEGATYQSIAAAGGGIAATVKATREASDEQLLQSAAGRLESALGKGTTTIEAKSGYGLSVQEELRHLRLLQQLKETAPQTISVTCLALHAASPDYSVLNDYIQAVTKELLPQVAHEKLADAVDAFVEQGYFSPDELRPYLKAAKDLGLAIRLHADEFTDSGGAALAGEFRARSADHMQFANADAIAALAKAGTVATILPGTSLYTGIPYADGSRFVDSEVPLAIATDANPGSCLLDNLAMMASLASLHGKVPPAYAVAGVTYVAAHSLCLAANKGHLAEGADGDFLVYRGMGQISDWLADCGMSRPNAVYIAGETVVA